jgi:hypothetical protein
MWRSSWIIPSGDELIMGCIQSTSFVVLINRAASRFFKESRWMRHGCPLSPLLFLIITEVIRKMIHKAKSSRSIRGFKVSFTEVISHLLFVDGIFCSTIGLKRDIITLKGILELFCAATRMVKNYEKSCLILN